MTGFSASFASNEADDGLEWAGTARVKGPLWSKLPLLTVGMLGLQIVWSVEMGYASPYLLSLGLSKSLMSIVFVAGPLSGLIVQPLIGVMADRSKSRFGRRRPYMLAGSLLCFAALLLLGFTSPFASIFVGSDNDLNRKLTIALAVLSIYCIDFTINAVQATDRALLVDILSTSEQDVGNAWAGRMSGVGSVAGFFVGNVGLPEMFPFFGKTQLQVLSVLTGLTLVLSHAITAFSVKEKVLVSDTRRGASKKSSGGVFSALKEIYTNTLTLPRVIRQICFIQFFSWIGWFPVLFYTSLWVNEIYVRENPGDDQSDAGIRAGNRALLYSSLIAMVAIIVMPFFVIGGNGPKTALPSGLPSMVRKKDPWWKCHVANLWAVSNFIFACAMGATLIVDSIAGANVVIGVTGFSWAITQWAPFALLGEAIHSSTEGPKLTVYEDDDSPIPMRDRRTRLSADERDELVFDVDHEDTPGYEDRATEFGNRSARASRMNLTDEESGDHEDALPSQGLLNGTPSTAWNGETHPDKESGIGDKAGIILGIHNVFIVIPQFLVTGMTSLIFALFEPQLSVLEGHHAGTSHPVPPINGTVSDLGVEILRRVEDVPRGFDSIGLVFRIGGASAAIAAILCWRLAKELRRP